MHLRAYRILQRLFFLPCLEDAIKKGRIERARGDTKGRRGNEGTEDRHLDEEAFQVSAAVSRLRCPLCFSRHSLLLPSHSRVRVCHRIGRLSRSRAALTGVHWTDEMSRQAATRGSSIRVACGGICHGKMGSAKRRSVADRSQPPR